MNGHSEHRAAEWNRQELYRSCMQALEGRCSTRSNVAKEYANHISEFTTTLKCLLIDQLHKKLEELNEPDRLLISRLSRALCELGDQQSTVLSRPFYHLSPHNKPAHRVWTMCTKDPVGLEKMIHDVCTMAGIPYEEKQFEKDEKVCDVRFSALPPSLWNVDVCALLLLQQTDIDENAIAARPYSREHFTSICSMNGFPICKSASPVCGGGGGGGSQSHRSTPSLPSPTIITTTTTITTTSRGLRHGGPPGKASAKSETNLCKAGFVGSCTSTGSSSGIGTGTGTTGTGTGTGIGTGTGTSTGTAGTSTGTAGTAGTRSTSVTATATTATTTNNVHHHHPRHHGHGYDHGQEPPQAQAKAQAQAQPQPPVEANVHVIRRSSFRERSLPQSYDSAGDTMKDDSNNLSVSNAYSAGSSNCPSIASSIPPYTTTTTTATAPSAADTSFDSEDWKAISERAVPSCGPSSSPTLTVGGGVGNFAITTTASNDVDEFCHYHFGDNFLTRPIDVIALPANLPTNLPTTIDSGGSGINSSSTSNEHHQEQPEQPQQRLLAISDSCGGIYITTTQGQVLRQLPIKSCSASSLAVDEASGRLLVSVMHCKGRNIHSFDIQNNFATVEVIPCPKEPKIELTRTRWITVSPRGDIFVVSGDNNRSGVWMYNRSRKGWKTLKDSRKTRYQYLCVAEDQPEYRAVVLLTCDAAQNRLLLFVVDHSGTLINEYDLTRTYHLDKYIRNPASAIVDECGNLLVLDYASGRLWVLLSDVKGVRRLKEIVFPRALGAQQALGIAVCNEWVFVTCFNRHEVVSMRYLNNGTFFALQQQQQQSQPPQDQHHHHQQQQQGLLAQRRAISLPRPTSARYSTYTSTSATIQAENI